MEMNKALSLFPNSYRSKIEISQGNCFSLIQKMEDNCVDLIATDPPYEINFEDNYWDKPNTLNWDYLAKEFKRVLKPNGALIIFQGWSQVCETKAVLDKHFLLKTGLFMTELRGEGQKQT